MALETIIPISYRMAIHITHLTFGALEPPPASAPPASEDVHRVLDITSKSSSHSQEPANIQPVLQRCEEVHEAFRDTSIKAVICNVGGSQANELATALGLSID